MLDIWFWQRIVTPHMAGLAVALARRGHAVTYAAEQALTEDRQRQGWRVPDLAGVSVRRVDSALAVRQIVAQASINSIHICQGLRANGLIGVAQRRLRRRGLRQWVTMETVDDGGPAGFAKRLLYRWLIARWRDHLQGVLAIGYRTESWIKRRGMPRTRVHPFSYFLSEHAHAPPRLDPERPFRVLFVGRFIPLKRLNGLINVLAMLTQDELSDFRLQVIGSGRLEKPLRARAKRALGQRLEWTGRLAMADVRDAMAAADCLVLPSRHEGWGAVVSEALMEGTPVIVSDACGAADVVRASGMGGVFQVDNSAALADQLRAAMKAGKVTLAQRTRLRRWAECLAAEAGAAYLLQILEHDSRAGAPPRAPWGRAHNASPKPCAG